MQTEPAVQSSTAKSSGNSPRKIPLSVMIPVFNETGHLPDCIASIKPLADEILVVDSFSTDGTPELAKKLGAKVLQHEYVNSAAQKNWTIPQCKHDWVFIIDADERATEELCAEINAMLSADKEPEQDGYFVARRTFFFGREIRHGGWESNDVQRLFKRDLGRYAEREVHADVEVKGGRSGQLKAKLDHHTCIDLNRYFQKFNRYTTQAAERYFREGRKAHFYDFLLRPFWEFFKMYFLKRGFLDGMPGFLVASFCSMTRFVRYAKLWSYQRLGRDRSKAYDICTTARDIDGEQSAPPKENNEKEKSETK